MSVHAVTKTFEATAGSTPSRRSVNGTTLPTSAATSRLVSRARASTTPSVVSPFHQ